MAKLVGLSAKRCVPCEEGKAQALSEPDANRLRNQVRCCLHVLSNSGLPAVPCVHLRKVQTPNTLQPRTCPHTSRHRSAGLLGKASWHFQSLLLPAYSIVFCDCEQVPGWRLVKGEGGMLSIKQEWKVRGVLAYRRLIYIELLGRLTLHPHALTGKHLGHKQERCACEGVSHSNVSCCPLPVCLGRSPCKAKACTWSP